MRCAFFTCLCTRNKYCKKKKQREAASRIDLSVHPRESPPRNVTPPPLMSTSPRERKRGAIVEETQREVQADLNIPEEFVIL